MRILQIILVKKSRYYYHFLPLFFLTMFLSGNISAQVKTWSLDQYEIEWVKVDALVDKGLPKSAIELVDQMKARAKEEANSPQYIKCVVYSIKLKADFEESSTENSISFLNEEIKIAKAPAKQIFQSMLAELYWSYYQSNRNDWLDRKVTVGFDNNDIKTWDLKRLVNEVIAQYQASLLDDKVLKSTSLKNFDILLQKGDKSKQYRPTVYDLLAHRAVDFFMDEEIYLTRPANTFAIDNKEYLAADPVFSSLKLQSDDSVSHKFYALKILQDLTLFHLEDNNRLALVDLDLKRLDFVRGHAVFASKDSLYLSVLRELARAYKDFEVVTEVQYKLAQEYTATASSYNPLISDWHKWDLKRADSLCNEAIAAFPASDGAINCKVLRNQIRERQLNLTLEYGNIPGKPFLGLLNYKNVKNLSFRVVRIDPDQQSTNLQRMDSKQLLDYYLAEKVVKSWNLTLPEDADLQPHSAEIRMPELDPGFYVVILSSDPQFSVNTGIFSWTPCWITNISYIDSKKDDGGYEMYVLDRKTGKPLANVKVTAYSYDYDYTSRSRNKKLWTSFTTLKDGYVKIPGPADRNDTKSFYLIFDQGSERFISDNYFYLSYYGNREKFIKPRAYLFTDRAIYRPGQTVFFKAIILEGSNNSYELKKDLPTSVTLIDANGKKVSSLDLQTNAFGSVSGSFNIPTGLLNGTMMISSTYGSTSIRVEEYKRPKFEIKFDAVSGSYKLGETLTVKGKAIAYAGNAIAAGSVKYRVVRMARFPYWYDYRMNIPPSPEAEIANGKLETSDDGSFAISFTAIADPSVSASLKPVFNYIVYADVTDLNGETHSKETTVSVGYTALNITTTIPDKLNTGEPNTFIVHSANMNAVFEPAEGVLTVSKLLQPNDVFKERKWDRPDKFTMTKAEFSADFPNDVYNNENDRSTWSVEKICFSKNFSTGLDTSFVISDLSNWLPGSYLVEIQSKDKFGQAVEVKRFITVFSTNSKSIPDPVYNWLSAIKAVAEPGEKAVFLYGSKAKKINVLYEVSSNNKLISRNWLKISNEQLKLEIPVKEEYRGNLNVSLIFVCDNRSYTDNLVIKVPYTNKDLDFKFASFRDHLLPGEQEKLFITITGRQAEKLALGTIASAETMFSMYDASLDVFAKNQWSFQLYTNSSSFSPWLTSDVFMNRGGMSYQKDPGNEIQPVFREFDKLNWFGYQLFTGYIRKGERFTMASDNASVPSRSRTDNGMKVKALEGTVEGLMTGGIPAQMGDTEGELLPKKEVVSGFGNPKFRSDFRETAFFYPDLLTNDKGEVVLEFTMPDALTRWKLMGLAHTKDLKTGTFTKEILTQKNLMVFPNLPRFVRTGDTVRLEMKIASLKDEIQGEASIELFDALSMQPIDKVIFGGKDFRNFTCSKNENALVGWTISIPEDIQAITVRFKASSANFSDAEETTLPVLSNRILVTESFPLPVKGNTSKSFIFSKFMNPLSTTIKNYKLSLEFTSNPVWYAVQALPYIMETNNGCTDEVFNRLFANSLGTYVAMANPKIAKVFENWKSLSPSTLLSNLEKNDDLKTITLQETPWVMNGRNESERKQNVARLFDFNRMEVEQQQAIRKLLQLQTSNGGWPWFPGLPDNRYITQYVITGLGRMERIGLNRTKNDKDAFAMIVKACRYMDQRIQEDYVQLLKYSPSNLAENHLEPSVIQYLYGRSFFITSIPLEIQYKTAFEYYSKQAFRYWGSVNPYLQAMVAISSNRYGNRQVADDILRSLKEKALSSEEMGMYWRDIQGYSWYQNPVQAQSLLIEAFDELRSDKESVDQMKLWLLKQKQTQDWKSTVATADACYALLLKGSDLIENQSLAKIELGGKVYDPRNSTENKEEAGSGYFKTSWSGSEIKPALGDIKVTNTNSGSAWGAMYWQYFEDLDKITPAQTPLSVSKALFVEMNTASGPVIKPLTSDIILKTGDKVTVRLVLKTDRDLEFVHMKDLRAAGFEPVNVLSGNKYQDGLTYYESTKDAATNFFFPDLKKGTYVFEYELIATVKGGYSNGISTVQCLYAPEFSAHSEGIHVKIQ